MLLACLILGKPMLIYIGKNRANEPHCLCRPLTIRLRCYILSQPEFLGESNPHIQHSIGLFQPKYSL